MDAKQFMEALDRYSGSATQKLIGDISTGYVYNDRYDPALLYASGEIVRAEKRVTKAYDDFKKYFKIKKVIFNEPVTIVIWDDDTKTVVKTQNNEIFDPEKGLAMAIAKRAYGNCGRYYHNFKKWIPAF